MSKLLVLLKQHTSLIHFKANEKDATIRITELKPKLDKFLVSKNEELNKCFFKDTKALNYKIKFLSIGNNSKSGKSNKIALYFGNMGNENEDKKRVFNDRVELEFFSFNEELIENIKNYIVEFFMYENFGTRQSKGFGSFTVEKLDGKVIDIDASLYPSKYYFDINIKNEDKLFSEIDRFYQSLRSKILCKSKNGASFSIDPMIKLYFESKGIIWDKKIIKNKIENKNIIDGKYLVKDLLGLSSSEKWKFQNCTVNKENDNIQRFKSPITFKIVKIKAGYRVFLILNKINSEFLNSEFSIKKNKKEILKLKIPEEFDLEDFINYSINNIEEYLESNEVVDNNNKKLLNMYKDIREGV